MRRTISSCAASRMPRSRMPLRRRASICPMRSTDYPRTAAAGSRLRCVADPLPVQRSTRRRAARANAPSPARSNASTRGSGAITLNSMLSIATLLASEPHWMRVPLGWLRLKARWACPAASAIAPLLKSGVPSPARIVTKALRDWPAKDPRSRPSSVIDAPPTGWRKTSAVANVPPIAALVRSPYPVPVNLTAVRPAAAKDESNTTSS